MIRVASNNNEALRANKARTDFLTEESEFVTFTKHWTLVPRLHQNNLDGDLSQQVLEMKLKQ